jgi:hypothetical protein
MANQRRRIEPRTLRGFTDVLPGLATRQRELVHVIDQSFASFGYEPIVTPAARWSSSPGTREISARRWRQSRTWSAGTGTPASKTPPRSRTSSQS